MTSDTQKGLFDRFKSLPIWQPAPVVGAIALIPGFVSAVSWLRFISPS